MDCRRREPCEPQRARTRPPFLAAIVCVPALALGALTTTPAPGVHAQPAVDTTIVIRSEGPLLEFMPPRIAAKAGTRVRLRFVNEGVLPHNVALPKDEEEIDELAQAAANAATTDYVPLTKRDRFFGFSKLAKPNETVEFVFTMPPPGTYRFVCLYPGHQNTMVGTLRSLR